MSTTIDNSSLVRSLLVSGMQAYDGNEWREAILAFLNGVWSGDVSITTRETLHFNNTTIRLGNDGRYYAYFVDEPDSGQVSVANKLSSEYLIVEANEHEVESGLIRFVRNNKTRQLVILFPGKVSACEGMILFTKGQKRSELYIATHGLVSMTMQMQRLGYRV